MAWEREGAMEGVNPTGPQHLVSRLGAGRAAGSGQGGDKERSAGGVRDRSDTVELSSEGRELAAEDLSARRSGRVVERMESVREQVRSISLKAELLRPEPPGQERRLEAARVDARQQEVRQRGVRLLAEEVRRQRDS